jgi:mannosyltransferase OCH1-like enzyme
MIPKTIHYCWFGKGPKSDLNVRCMESWRRIMPDYEIREWNESNSPLRLPYARAAYRKKIWSRVTNYVRFHALHTEGGIYLDTDVEVLKPFDPLLHHECFMGFQVREEMADWVNSAVTGSRPGHPFLKACMERTTRLFAETGELPRSPTVVTMLLREMGLTTYGLQQVQGVTLYPREYFYPFSWTERFTPDCIQDATYCVHYWEVSWAKAVAPPVPFRKRLKRLRRAVVRWLRGR